jgi:hypothetical protein
MTAKDHERKRMNSGWQEMKKNVGECVGGIRALDLAAARRHETCGPLIAVLEKEGEILSRSARVSHTQYS